jgi:biopolymer transport protein ExbD
MGKRYNIEFTQAELRQFEKYPSSMGVPILKMKEFLAAKDAKEKSVFETGIPIDSTDNQLAMWILYARQINPDVQACIKGDSKTAYPIVKKVLGIMQDYKVNRFNLITNLEAVKINVAEIQK